ncbi:hypothetical protein MRS44_004043 [Fusarium solani]|uniref:uncharacterized protein n=1 Tax=Fusarium solani TaxID=169388 RepID=UPI0032C4960B|nr:hypothetical protein MRS44_004043 [Fusarium solani]
MLVPSRFRLLSALVICGLLGYLTQARPVLPRIALAPLGTLPTPKAEGKTLTSESGTSDFHALSSKWLNPPTKLDKRLMRPYPPGHDDFGLEYYLHKNVSQVYEESIQDAIWRVVDTGGKPALEEEPGDYRKTKDHWIHPDFEWRHIPHG